MGLIVGPATLRSSPPKMQREFQSKELADATGELAKREFAGGITNVYWVTAQK
jgi:hypothetical protein